MSFFMLLVKLYCNFLTSNLALRSMLTKVLEQQAEILERLKRIEKREDERENNKKDEQIYVPPSVRVNLFHNFRIFVEFLL